MQIIGLSGTNGSGKDTVGHILADRYNYLFITVTDLLREECRNRDLPVIRENLRAISAEWRRAHGLAVLVDRAVESWQATGNSFDGLVMASLRNPFEADRVHELGGTMVWVDADPHVRFNRLSQARPGRESEDGRTFEQFLAEEQAEMHPAAGSDDTVLNMAAVRDRCDLTVQNNTSSPQILLNDIQKTLGLM